MKIPKDIVGRNKHRDLKILLDWAEGLMTFDGLAVKYELTQRRITQILMANHAYVKIDKDWEKKQRIHYIKSQMKTAKDTEANRLSLQQELRTELEGDKPLIQQETHLHFTTVVEELHATATGNNDKARTSTRDIGSLEG